MCTLVSPVPCALQYYVTKFTEAYESAAEPRWVLSSCCSCTGSGLPTPLAMTASTPGLASSTRTSCALAPVCSTISPAKPRALSCAAMSVPSSGGRCSWLCRCWSRTATVVASGPSGLAPRMVSTATPRMVSTACSCSAVVSPSTRLRAAPSCSKVASSSTSITGSSSTPTQKSGRGRRGAGEMEREGKGEDEGEDEGGSSSASSAFISAASDGAVGAAPPRSVAAVAGFLPHEAVGGSGAGSISPTGSTQWKVTRSRPLASRCDEIHARPCAAAAASRTVLSPMPLDRVLARPACPLAPRSKHAEHSAPLIGWRSARSWLVSVTCSSSCPVRCCALASDADPRSGAECASDEPFLGAAPVAFAAGWFVNEVSRPISPISSPISPSSPISSMSSTRWMRAESLRRDDF
mmetsp:Transcript_24112/g.57645  ORF Transcript_24112/g.57645 Transcript_24112/m.57645 type:complete len:408 (+) Transcript_24112:135-1358(+)